MEELKHYQQVAVDMVKADEERDRAFLDYEAMYHGKWDLPAEMETLGWVRKYVDTDPHDAVEAGVRVLASLEPSVTMTPLRNDPLTKRDANHVERNLLWQLKSANRRRANPVEADVVRSALLYAAVALNVVDLDHHIKMLTQENRDTKRAKAARRASRFVVQTFNPRQVHIKESSYGAQCVLLTQERTVSDICQQWGMKSIEKLKPDDVVKYYDYTDYDVRCVWVQSADNKDKPIEIIRQEHQLDFFPWVAVMGGSSLESKIEDKYHPILYSIRNSGQWRTKNVVMSLAVSEVISHAAAPRFKEEGPNADFSEIDYSEPGRPAKVPAGNTLTPIPTPPIDQALTEVADRITNAIAKGTVSQVLQGAGLPSGTSFAAYNQATQNAMSALRPTKRLAEQALSEMFVLMMMWVKQTKQPMYAYGSGKRTDMGTEYVIEPDDFDESALYIDVNLNEQVPTDYLQRANAASMMVQTLRYPREYALEDVGVTDPQAAMQQSYLEEFVNFKFQQMLKAEGSQLDLQLQGMAQQLQAAQAQEQQQMEAQAMAEQQAMMGPTPGGQGFNPAMGGTPPAVAFPQGTREMMTGEDMSGNPLAGGL